MLSPLHQCVVGHHYHMNNIASHAGVLAAPDSRGWQPTGVCPTQCRLKWTQTTHAHCSVDISHLKECNLQEAFGRTGNATGLDLFGEPVDRKPRTKNADELHSIEERPELHTGCLCRQSAMSTAVIVGELADIRAQGVSEGKVRTL